MARTPNTKKGTRPPKEQSSTKNFDIVDLEKNSRIPDQSAPHPNPVTTTVVLVISHGIHINDRSASDPNTDVLSTNFIHNKRFLDRKALRDYHQNLVTLVQKNTTLPELREHFNDFVIWIINITKGLHDIINSIVMTFLSIGRENSLLSKIKTLHDDVYTTYSTILRDQPNRF